MICKKCGNQIPENVQFCPMCGEPVTTPNQQNNFDNTNAQVPFQEGVNAVSPVPMPDTVSYETTIPPKKKNGKLIAIISIIAVVVIASIVAVVAMIINSGDKNTTSPSSQNEDEEEIIEEEFNGYEEEVMAYLDCLVKKKFTADKYISDLYFADGFPSVHSGKKAKDIHEIIMRASFEKRKEEADMGYYYESFDYDTWQDAIKDNVLDKISDTFENTYGSDWELTYKIKDSEKMSESDTEDLYDIWEDDILEMYHYNYINLDLDRDETDEFESFLQELEDFTVEEAYTVDTKITISGDDDSYKTNSEFIVAKIGDDWVILDGISVYELAYAE